MTFSFGDETVRRRAEPADAVAIAELNVSAWRATYRGLIPDAFLDSMDARQIAGPLREVMARPDTDVMVAVDAHNILCGFGLLAPSRDSDAASNTGEIVAIYVDPDRWRSGVGSALLDDLIRAAGARACASVTLWVLSGNQRARAFYEARGFVVDGTEKSEQKWGGLVREIRYARRLAG